MDSGAAFVTGSSRGIGRAIATALASDGFAVAINAPPAEAEEAEETIAAIQAAGGDAIAALGDVADIASHEAMLDQVEARLGPLTCLVNNAGVSVISRGDLLDVSPESYDRCQAVNTRAGFFLSQAFGKRLVSRPRAPKPYCSLINITSANAVAVSVNRGEYCVSKAAMSAVSQLFAVRLGEHDIGVYEIQPGVIETAMTAPALQDYRERIDNGLTVNRRLGQPEDIGRIALLMAKGSLAYSPGQAVRVDGGLLIPRL